MRLTMGSTEKSRSEDWKDKYFKALNELDDQERLRAEKVARVSRDLLLVLQRFRGASPAFDQDLEQLAKHDQLSEDRQQTRLRGLVGTLESLELPALTAPPAAAPVSVDNAAPLRELLDRLKVPARMRPLFCLSRSWYQYRFFSKR